jgi:hypothetical protein
MLGRSTCYLSQEKKKVPRYLEVDFLHLQSLDDLILNCSLFQQIPGPSQWIGIEAKNASSST